MLVQLIRDDGVAAMRDPGFYWVRRLGESSLQVARWSGLSWFLVGYAGAFTDDDLAAISNEQLGRPTLERS